MQKVTTQYLKLIPFLQFDLWDTKRYTSKSISSAFEIVELGICIREENRKYKLFEKEETDFGILGVNNKEGIFDAYIQMGKEINQAYKKMEIGWLAYNPYRINVGSIGVRLKHHQNEYISPAYVVFSCLNNILPEYLFLLFKTEVFNKVINESTTGSVRQNLTFEILKKLKIPLPSLQLQEKLVTNYYKKIQEAEGLAQQAGSLEDEFEKYLFEVLGYKLNNLKAIVEEGTFLRVINFLDIDKWGVDQNNIFNTLIQTKNYASKKISEICTVSSGGTPSRDRKEYYNGDIPWIKTGEVVNNIIYDTEEKITKEAISNSSAKIYPKNSLIIAMYGQGLTRGRTAKLGIDASTNQACAVLFNIDNTKVLTDFLWIYLMGEYDRLREMASGNNQPNLNAQMVKDYKVILPPLGVQSDIIKKYKTFKSNKKLVFEKSQLLKSAAEQQFEKSIFN